MIDVNITVVYQAANFLLMLWFLNRFVFKPILRVVEERERKLSEMDHDAQRIAKDGEKILAMYEDKVLKMRREAVEIVNSARKEAQEKASAVLAEARSKFDEEVEKSMELINREVAEASTELKKDVGAFAETLVHKILGRKVSSS